MNSQQSRVLRELTPEEILLVAGGASGTNGTIPVVGNPPSGGGGYSPGPGPAGGGDSGGDPPHTSDCTATHAARDIVAAHSNATPQEYGDFIFRTSSGEIQHGTIVAGGQYSTAPYDIAAYGIPDGATIIGFEHNHPTFNSDGAELIERAYADNADLYAVQNPQGYANSAHNITVDVSNFAGYIVYDRGTSNNDYVVDKYSHADTVGIDYSGASTTIHPEATKSASTDMNGPGC